MMNELLAIPDKVIFRYLLNRNETMIGEDWLTFCNTGQRCDLAFLPELAIDAMLYDRFVEHC
ncbi:hypothetical protein [Blautia massiliensis (ex Durand et al. 2017)]|uniref:hypothetical protein n=1 Tax=Blautia massiliensis (ex Durand et al. 2017) TaxID=1737424 RepID=UPI00242BD23E|nr:hypothetical protein [Blautia massiliensis (ex Durand et al. 2017)]MDD6548990.1 hypothetical protein [Blautia massiliensis (ex Durand et al. 2017)]